MKTLFLQNKVGTPVPCRACGIHARSPRMKTLFLQNKGARQCHAAYAALMRGGRV